jgi:hypothetical protein
MLEMLLNMFGTASEWCGPAYAPTWVQLAEDDLPLLLGGVLNLDPPKAEQDTLSAAAETCAKMVAAAHNFQHGGDCGCFKNSTMLAKPVDMALP